MDNNIWGHLHNVVEISPNLRLYCRGYSIEPALRHPSTEEEAPKKTLDFNELWGIQGQNQAMTTKEWTPQRTAALIALWEEGLTTSVMGQRLGVTKNAVVGKVHRLGLPKRASSPRAKPPVEEKRNTVKLAALTASMCCWPDGEPGTDDFHFCGEPVAPERPYCAAHCARAYVKSSKDRKPSVAA